MTKRKCALILPYFGRFNNYFQLFLNTFSHNTDYDLLLFTDSEEQLTYPSNVKVFKSTLKEVKKIADEKLGFDASLSSPYKLCDYKPSYGLLFEEYIENYEYWGHCDCDLIFGNLNEILTPVLDEDYDKLFGAGHLTIYKNTPENNRRFMKPYQGELIYKDAFTTDSIYVLDEDVREKNVHRLFLEDGAKVFEKDLSMNPTTSFARFRRSYYNGEKKKFTWEPFKEARYYWQNGNIVEANYNRETESVEYKGYIYMHLQRRKMRLGKKVYDASVFQILPDRFKCEKNIPKTKKEMKLATIKLPYLYWNDVYKAKIAKKLKALIG